MLEKTTPREMVGRIQEQMREIASQKYIGSQEATLERKKSLKKKMQATVDAFLRDYPLEILTRGNGK